MQVTGEITDLAYGGAGVLPSELGVVMVRRAFFGDRVRVRLVRRRKGVLEGEIETLLEPSPERVAAPCPHLSVCGGCALQGLAPDAQTRYKAHQVTELLRRIGRVTPAATAPPWHSPTPWYYRNKMEFTFAPRAWLAADELARGLVPPPGVALGLHPRGRFDAVFNLSDCRLQSPLSNRIVAAMRDLARERNLCAYRSREDRGLLRHLVVRQAATSDDLLVVLVARQEDPVLGELAAQLRAHVPEVTGVVASINLRRATVAQGDYEIPLGGASVWRERVAGFEFVIGASAFFQTQTAGAEALVAEALARAELNGTERVLDLYCGAGAFSLPFAAHARHVHGVEVLASAVAEARANAARAGVSNVTFDCQPVETKTPQPWEASDWDLVLLDPPRSGLHPRALEKLLARGVPRIVYVSCNPSTLARDAGRLVDEGGYRARHLRVFDLFPQTPHVESVLLLAR